VVLPRGGPISGNKIASELVSAIKEVSRVLLTLKSLLNVNSQREAHARV